MACGNIKVFLALIGLVISTVSVADPPSVLPVFNNFWYSSATDADSADICNPGIDIFNYTNKYSTQQELQNFIVSNLPKHTDCTWQPLVIYHSSSAEFPPDFPGNLDDYHTLLQTGSPGMLEWNTTCLNNENKIRTDFEQGEFIPGYICPSGSKSSLGTTDPGTRHCYQYTNFSCEGDIAGRDLNVPVISQEGHVGIISALGTLPWTPNYYGSIVLEVLNENPVIRLSSLASFINAVPGHYWGTKYGISGYPNLTSKQFAQMMVLAANESNYAPTYTYGWSWWPGGPAIKYVFNLNTLRWQQKLVTLNGQFRCDSFVYYLFKNGAGINIPYSSFMTPKTLFDTFLNYRGSDPLSANNIIAPISTSMVKENIEDEIQKLFSASTFDSNQADQLTYSYINDSTIDRNEKLTFLWNLAKQYQSIPVKFMYLVGVFSNLQPAENASDIIVTYNALQDQNSKLSLLALMNNSIYYSTLQETQALTQEQINGIIEIEKFLQNQLRTTSDKLLYQHLYSTNANLLTKEEFEQITSHASLKTTNSGAAIASIQFMLAEPVLLNNYLQYPASISGNKQFKMVLCGYIALLPVNYLDSTQKQMLLNYLKSNQTLLSTQSAMFQGCDYNNVLLRLK